VPPPPRTITAPTSGFASISAHAAVSRRDDSGFSALRVRSAVNVMVAIPSAISTSICALIGSLRSTVDDPARGG
jgi:hypothetical protein